MTRHGLQIRDQIYSKVISRCDPKVPMAAYDDRSPLETAIDYNRMELWNIMREGLELSETKKLEQLCRMIVAEKMDPDDPWKEFKELLGSLPIELVFIALIFGQIAS